MDCIITIRVGKYTKPTGITVGALAIWLAKKRKSVISMPCTIPCV